LIVENSKLSKEFFTFWNCHNIIKIINLLRGGAICEEMKPLPDEVIVHGKIGLCAFASTNLDFILRQNGIETIALAGYLTNCCVESSMRTAYEKGYNVITLTDCTAATSVEEQEAAVKFTYPMFSLPRTSFEFLGMF
jgi:ureidoacrylate peracid hydrolase